MHPIEQAIADIANDIGAKNRRITWLEEEVEWLKVYAEREYSRGREEGSSCQAILEIQGQKRFLKQLKDDGCPGCPHKEAVRENG